MSEAKHSPLPWVADLNGTLGHIKSVVPGAFGTPTVARYDVETPSLSDEVKAANRDLIVIAVNSHATLTAERDQLLAEMVRYLPVIERAEQDPELWARLTVGTGIATANGYREAIRKTQPNLEVK